MKMFVFFFNMFSLQLLLKTVQHSTNNENQTLSPCLSTNYYHKSVGSETLTLD